LCGLFCSETISQGGGGEHRKKTLSGAYVKQKKVFSLLIQMSEKVTPGTKKRTRHAKNRPPTRQPRKKKSPVFQRATNKPKKQEMWHNLKKPRDTINRGPPPHPQPWCGVGGVQKNPRENQKLLPPHPQKIKNTKTKSQNQKKTHPLQKTHWRG